MPELHLRTVDLEAYVRDPSSEAGQHVVSQFDEAMRAYGVVQVRAACVSGAAIADLRTHAARFFAQPAAVKRAHAPQHEYGGPGYTAPGVEAVARTRREDAPAARDRVESLVFLEQDETETAPYPPQLARAVVKYARAMRALLKVVMRMMSDALGLADNFFDECYRTPETSLRLANYPEVLGSSSKEQVVYGAHTDYTGFTFLNQDCGETFPKRGAMEVYLEDRWYTVPPVKDTLVVNAGDLIRFWTNDMYKSPVHRVTVRPPLSVPRLSLVYFTGPSNDTVVRPLEVCCAPGTPPKFKSVTAGEWLYSKLLKSNR